MEEESPLQLLQGFTATVHHLSSHFLALHLSMVDLEAEVKRFENNCVEFSDYQNSVLTICTVWSAWLGANTQSKVIKNEEL